MLISDAMYMLFDLPYVPNIGSIGKNIITEGNQIMSATLLLSGCPFIKYNLAIFKEILDKSAEYRTLSKLMIKYY
jgi:hypothetical protein